MLKTKLNNNLIKKIDISVFFQLDDVPSKNMQIKAAALTNFHKVLFILCKALQNFVFYQSQEKTQKQGKNYKCIYSFVLQKTDKEFQ